MNERPPNARTSWTAGIAGLTVGAGVGAGVAGAGDGDAVGDADGDTDPDGEDDGAAVGDDALAELADAAGEAPPVVATESDEHADANASASAMATRPCRIVFTLAMREDAAGSNGDHAELKSRPTKYPRAAAPRPMTTILMPLVRQSPTSVTAE